MATYSVLESKDGYSTVQVEFADQVFVQQIVSPLTGPKLDKQLQDYADAYEAEWLALNGIYDNARDVA